MTVASTTSADSSIYNQYQTLISRFESGELSYQEALAEHRDLFPRVRGHMATGVVGRLDDTDLVTGELAEEFRSRLIPSHLLAAKAYGNANAGADERPRDTGSSDGGKPPLGPAVPMETIIGFGLMREVRNDLNSAAYDFLFGYARDNSSAWMKAADELGINAGSLAPRGGGVAMWDAAFLRHFYRVPSGSGIDVSAGVANSEAERIFRHVASPTEVAAFNRMMAGTRNEMETRLEEKVSRVLDTYGDRMAEFAPHLPTIEAAGLTTDDLAGVLLSRDDDGQYVVESPTDKAAAIEAVINGNADLRALYDAQWEHIVG